MYVHIFKVINFCRFFMFKFKVWGNKNIDSKQMCNKMKKPTTQTVLLKFDENVEKPQTKC